MMRMDIKSFWKKHFLIISIIAVALAVRIILLFDYHSIWWDDSVYLSMGKYLFSLGHAGFYENIRPIFVPIILGFMWVISGAKAAIILGRVFEIMLSLASVVLVYLICKKVFDEKTALISSALLAFSSITLFMNYHLYTEIPVAFFILLALYLFFCRKYFFSGVMFCIALLCKFPAAIFFIALFLFLVFEYFFLRKKEKISVAGFIVLGFLSIFIPYLVFNQIVAGNPISPLTDASAIMNQVVGSNFILHSTWYYYLEMILRENILQILVLVGLVFTFTFSKKEPNHNKLILGFLLLFSMLYFSTMKFMEYRYLIMFLPLFCIFSGYGVIICLNWIPSGKKYFYLALAIVLILSCVSALNYYQKNHDDKYTWVDREYHDYLAGKNFTGDILIGNPVLSTYIDNPVMPMYYPVWNSGLAEARLAYIKENSTRIQAVVFDSCEGGMTCAQSDLSCLNKTAELIAYLDSNLKVDYYKEAGRCKFYAYVPK